MRSWKRRGGEGRGESDLVGLVFLCHPHPSHTTTPSHLLERAEEERAARRRRQVQDQGGEGHVRLRPVLEGGEEGAGRQLLFPPFLPSLPLLLPQLLPLRLARRARLQEPQAVHRPVLLPRRPQTLPRQVRGQRRQPLPAPRGLGGWSLGFLGTGRWPLLVVIAAQGIEGPLPVPPHVAEEQREALWRWKPLLCVCRCVCCGDEFTIDAESRPKHCVLPRRCPPPPPAAPAWPQARGAPARRCRGPALPRSQAHVVGSLVGGFICKWKERACFASVGTVGYV